MGTSSPKSLKFFLWSVIKAKAEERCSDVRRSQWSKESVGVEAPGKKEELEEGSVKDCLVLLVPALTGHGGHGASHAGHPDKKTHSTH